jgi:uncharacterized protein (DUF2141 family)
MKQKRLPAARFSNVFLGAEIVAASGLALPALAQQASPAIRVGVADVTGTSGRVGCSIFKSADGFPNTSAKAVARIWAPLSNGGATCDFNRIPAGTYAIAVFHDAAMTGSLTRNFFGMPTEEYGFSNNARASLTGPPSFAAASFSYDGTGTKSISIDLVH